MKYCWCSVWPQANWKELQMLLGFILWLLNFLPVSFFSVNSALLLLRPHFNLGYICKDPISNKVTPRVNRYLGWEGVRTWTYIWEGTIQSSIYRTYMEIQAHVSVLSPNSIGINSIDCGIDAHHFAQPHFKGIWPHLINIVIPTGHVDSG